MYSHINLITLASAAFLPLSFALPTSPNTIDARKSGDLSSSDMAVAELALFLEHLEFSLYSGGYENFTDEDYLQYGFPEGFRDGIILTAMQEGVHASILTDVLMSNNAVPIPDCSYNFPYSNPKEFVELANMITTVGIGAYLGGALSLMDNKKLLTEAASILTVEARHDSFLRAGLLASPFPTSFDTSLTAVWAYNLALMFVESCPMYLPLIELPQLMVTNPPAPADPAVPPPATLTFNWDPTKFFVTVDPNEPLYIAFVNQQMPTVFVEVTSCGVGCGTVPTPGSPLSGAVFAALTTFKASLNETGLTDYGTLAGPAELILY